MAWISQIFTSSSVWTSSGILLKAVELSPDGGEVEIRVYRGTDNTGTELYRLRAQERSEYRAFKEGLQLNGPLYLYFQEGTGALVVMY